MPVGGGGNASGGAFSAFQHTQTLERAYNLTHGGEPSADGGAGRGGGNRSTARARARVAQALLAEGNMSLPSHQQSEQPSLDRQLSTRYLPTQAPFSSLSCAELLSAQDIAELAVLFDVYNVLPNGESHAAPENGFAGVLAADNAGGGGGGGLSAYRRASPTASLATTRSPGSPTTSPSSLQSRRQAPDGKTAMEGDNVNAGRPAARGPWRPNHEADDRHASVGSTGSATVGVQDSRLPLKVMSDEEFFLSDYGITARRDGADGDERHLRPPSATRRPGSGGSDSRRAGTPSPSPGKGRGGLLLSPQHQPPQASRKRKLRVGSGLRLTDSCLTRNEDDVALSREWLVELLLDIIARKLDNPAVAAVWLPAINTATAPGSPGVLDGGSGPGEGGLTTGLTPLTLPHAADTATPAAGGLAFSGFTCFPSPTAAGGRRISISSNSDVDSSRPTLPVGPTRRESMTSALSSSAGPTVATARGMLGADPTLSLHRAKRREQKQSVLGAFRAELLRWVAPLAQPCDSRQHPSVWQLCEEQVTMLQRFHQCLLAANGLTPGAGSGSAADPTTAIPRPFFGAGGTARRGTLYLATRRRSSCTMVFPVEQPDRDGGRLPQLDSAASPPLPSRRRESVVSIVSGSHEDDVRLPDDGELGRDSPFGGAPDAHTSPPSRSHRGLKGPIPSFLGGSAQNQTGRQHSPGRRGQPLPDSGNAGNSNNNNSNNGDGSGSNPYEAYQLPATPLVLYGERLDGRPSPMFRDILVTRMSFHDDEALAAALGGESKGNALQQWRCVRRAQQLQQRAQEATRNRSPTSASAQTLPFSRADGGDAGGSRARRDGPGGDSGNAEGTAHTLVCWSDFSNNIIMQQPLVPQMQVSRKDVPRDGSPTPTREEMGRQAPTQQAPAHELVYTRVATMMLEEGHASAAANGGGHHHHKDSSNSRGDEDDEDDVLDGVGGGGLSEGRDGAGGGGTGGRRRRVAGRRAKGGGGGGNALTSPNAAAAMMADLEDFAEELKGLHAQSADHVLVSAPHRLIITASKDGVVKLWESGSGLFVANALNCGSSWVLGMYLLHDDQYLLVATSNAEITVVELPSCAVIQKMRGCTSLVTALKTVVQPAAHHTQRYGMKPGACGPHRLEFRPSMTPEVYAAMLKESQLSDSDARLSVRPIEGYVCPSAVYLDVDRSLLLFGTTEGVVGVVDLSHELKRATLLSGVCTRAARVADTFQAHEPGTRVMGVLLASHARAVISSAQDGSVSRAPLSLPGLSSAGDAACPDKDASLSGTAAPTASTAMPDRHATPSLSIATVTDANKGSNTAGVVAATASVLKFGPPLPSLTTNHSIRSMCYCPTSRLFATVHSDRRVLLWNAGRTTTELVHQFPQEAQDIVSMALQPRHQRVALLTEDHDIRVYDFRGFRPLAVISSSLQKDNRVEEMASVTIKCSANDADGCLAFSPEGNQLVCALRGPVIYKEAAPPTNEGVRRSLGPAVDRDVAATTLLPSRPQQTESEDSEGSTTGSGGSGEDDDDGQEGQASGTDVEKGALALKRKQRRAAKDAAQKQRRDMLTACRLEPRTTHRHGIVDLCVHPTQHELHTFSMGRWKVWDLLSGCLKRECDVPRQVRQQMPSFSRILVTSCGWSTEQHTRLIIGARFGCIATLDALTGALVNAQQVTAKRHGSGTKSMPLLPTSSVKRSLGVASPGRGSTRDAEGDGHKAASGGGGRDTGGSAAAAAAASGLQRQTCRRHAKGACAGALDSVPTVDYRDTAQDLDVTVVTHEKTRTFICAGDTCVVRRYVPGTVRPSGEEEYTEMRVHLPSSPAATATAMTSGVTGGRGADSALNGGPPPSTTTITACCVIRDTHMCLGTIDSRLFFYRLVDESAPYAEESLRKHVDAAAKGAGAGADERDIGAVVGLFFLNDKNQNLLLVVLETGVMHVYAYLQSVTLARLRLCRAGECRIRRTIHRPVRSIAGVDSALVLGDSLGRVHIFDVSGFTADTADFRRALGRPRCVFQAAMDEVSALDSVTHAPPTPAAKGRPYSPRSGRGLNSFLPNRPGGGDDGSVSRPLHRAASPGTRGVVRVVDMDTSTTTSAEDSGGGGAADFSPTSLRGGGDTPAPPVAGTTYLVVGSLDGNVRLFLLRGADSLSNGRLEHHEASERVRTSLSPTSTAAAITRGHAPSLSTNTAAEQSSTSSRTHMGPGEACRLDVTTVGLFGFDAWTMGCDDSYSDEPLPPSATATAALLGSGGGMDERFLDTVLESQARNRMLHQNQLADGDAALESNTAHTAAAALLSTHTRRGGEAADVAASKQQGGKRVTVVTREERAGQRRLMHRHTTSARPERTLGTTNSASACETGAEALVPAGVDDSEWAGIEMQEDAVGGAESSSPLLVADEAAAAARKHLSAKARVLSLLPRRHPSSHAMDRTSRTSSPHSQPFLATTTTATLAAVGDGVEARHNSNSRGLQHSVKGRGHGRNPLVHTYPVSWLRKVGVLHPSCPLPDYDDNGEPHLISAEVAFDPALNRQLFASDGPAEETAATEGDPCGDRPLGGDAASIFFLTDVPCSSKDEADGVVVASPTRSESTPSLPSHRLSTAKGTAVDLTRLMVSPGSSRSAALSSSTAARAHTGPAIPPANWNSRSTSLVRVPGAAECASPGSSLSLPMAVKQQIPQLRPSAPTPPLDSSSLRTAAPTSEDPAASTSGRFRGSTVSIPSAAASFTRAIATAATEANAYDKSLTGISRTPRDSDALTGGSAAAALRHRLNASDKAATRAPLAAQGRAAARPRTSRTSLPKTPLYDPTVALLRRELAGLSNEVVEQRVDQLMLAHMAKGLDRLQPAGYEPGSFTSGVKQLWLRRSGDAAVVAATREATATASVASVASAARTRLPHPLTSTVPSSESSPGLPAQSTSARVPDLAASSGVGDTGSAFSPCSSTAHRRDMAALQALFEAKLHAPSPLSTDKTGAATTTWGLDLTIATLPTESITARYGSCSDANHLTFSSPSAFDEGADVDDGGAPHASEAHVPARERLHMHLARRQRQRERAAMERRRIEAQEEERAAKSTPGASGQQSEGSEVGGRPNPRRWLPQVSARQTLQPVSVTLPAALSSNETAKAQWRQLQKVANSQ